MIVEDDPSEEFPRRVGGQSRNLMNTSKGGPLGGSDPSPKVLKQWERKIQRREGAREESGMKNTKKISIEKQKYAEWRWKKTRRDAETAHVT